MIAAGRTSTDRVSGAEGGGVAQRPRPGDGQPLDPAGLGKFQRQTEGSEQGERPTFDIGEEPNIGRKTMLRSGGQACCNAVFSTAGTWAMVCVSHRPRPNDRLGHLYT